MERITRRGPVEMDAAEFAAMRARYTSTLVDLGTGDGAWPRRFAREYPQCLAVGVDSDRDALQEAAKQAERKPARGGAENAVYIAAQAENLPPELSGAANWVTIHFPWSKLLSMILSGDKQLGQILNNLCAKQARLTIVLNAEAATEGVSPPTPDSIAESLKPALEGAGMRLSKAEWLEQSQAPPTRWAGRLVKGSGRAMVSVEALR